MADELVPQGPWPRGVDNVSKEEAVSGKALRIGENVDLDRDGWPSRRVGRTLRMELEDGHSGWSGAGLCLVQDAGNLVLVDVNEWSKQVVATGLNPYLVVAYTVAGRDVFWSNGEQSGRIRDGVNGPWGMPVPGQPAVEGVSTGGMVGGRYQVVLTFERLDGPLKGEESGAGLSQLFDVVDGAGYLLSSIPQWDGCGVNVYLSKPGGSDLYWIAQVAPGVTSAEFGGRDYHDLLDKQHLAAPPAGHSLLTYDGVIYIAVGNVLYWTEPQSYGLFRPAANFQPFAGRLVLLGETKDGFYVSADKTYFLSGTSPEELVRADDFTDKAVEGTALRESCKKFPKIEYNGMAPVWFTDNGAMVGLPSGMVVPLMEGRVAVDEYERGAALYREREGVRQMLFALRDKQASSGFGATDYSTLEIRRGGVAE